MNDGVMVKGGILGSEFWAHLNGKARSSISLEPDRLGRQETQPITTLKSWNSTAAPRKRSFSHLDTRQLIDAFDLEPEAHASPSWHPQLGTKHENSIHISFQLIFIAFVSITRANPVHRMIRYPWTSLRRPVLELGAGNIYHNSTPVKPNQYFGSQELRVISFTSDRLINAAR